GTVLSGGAQTVGSGGLATATNVVSGGSQTVQASGSVSSTTVLASGSQTVFGSASGTVLSGGAQTVGSGGSATTTTVASGGSQTVQASGSVSGTTILASGSQTVLGTASGTVLSGGTALIGSGGLASGTQVLASGRELVVSGGTAAGTTVSSGGTLEVQGGANVSGTTLISGGTLAIGSGYVDTGRTIESGVSLAVLSGGTVSNAIVGSGGIQVISGGTAIGTRFARGSILQLAGVTFNGNAVATVDANDLLTVSDNSGTRYTQQLAGGYTPGQFAVRDGAGTTIPDTVVCFVAGTRIRVMRDGRVCDVPVETLAIGDRVVTADGALRPVIWLGHRHLDCDAHPNSALLWPVRVLPGAFGGGLPERPLRLSPGHPVLVGADADGAGGVLVPVMCLINGTSIAREAAPSVTYWHVELDAHDILLAEGLPVESYLDWGDRAFFEEASDHALHNPDFVVPGLSQRCRPVLVEGAVVEAERRRLDQVFAASLEAQGLWTDGEAFFRAS
ncbi:MAG TPA: Hint domain-containing protein, partial [Methylorubrum populi]|nr:Hint domain-containing protein [Methylorubrum populi]